jgi:hypothetical protein
MLRIGIAIAAITFIVSASEACVNCKSTRGMQEKGGQCRGLVHAKNLKGEEAKSEWRKCMENPENYK